MDRALLLARTGGWCRRGVLASQAGDPKPEPSDHPPVERVPGPPGRSFDPWAVPVEETEDELADAETPWFVEPSDAYLA